jgi:hypothetical protein
MKDESLNKKQKTCKNISRYKRQSKMQNKNKNKNRNKLAGR